MSKYIIHACPQRMWYVEEYLIPSMKAQGIDNVLVECDYKQTGNLISCMNIFSHMGEPGGSWHLQDDVIICRDFKKRTEDPTNDIVCGFVIKKDENIDHVGYVSPQNMWWSFPCIHIPNMIARDCANWFEHARYRSNYSWMVMSKKNDDSLFKEFLIKEYPDYNVLNLRPNLVDHVDYLLGGTVINKQRKNKNTRSAWFEDTDLVDELEKKIRGNNG